MKLISLKNLSKPYLIAEIGVNHENISNLLKKLSNKLKLEVLVLLSFKLIRLKK